MTDALRRAAATTLLASFPGERVPAWLLDRVTGGLGGVCLYGSNREADLAAVAATVHGARPDVLVALDEEGGDVTRLEAAGGSSVPGNAALGVVDDLDLTRTMAAALGAALGAAGVDLDLAPCADANTDPANPVVGVRSFGADPELVARHTAAFVDGLQGAGVAACVKHFPGHGAVDVDSHLDLPTLTAPLELLRSRELVPFQAAIDAGSAAVMTGHLRVPALDDQAATVSHRTLAGLLRGELGFAGAVVTDALDMAGIGGPAQIPANVVRAVAAGADLCCLGPDNTDELVGACIRALVEGVASGALPEARLLDAGVRVAALRFLPRDRWPEQPIPRQVSSLGAIGAEAARRALRIDGELPAALSRAHVVELDRPPNIAAGTVPWGLARALGTVDAATTAERLSESADGDAVARTLATASNRPLVIVVRDPQRRPAGAALLHSLLAARPDAIVVDMGWPGVERLPESAARITTFGASRAGGEAAAAILAGAGAATPRRTFRG
ncbi:MAG: glycoside hydrolase family 3 protein [Acidimicrobiales bacterium]